MGNPVRWHDYNIVTRGLETITIRDAERVRMTEDKTEHEWEKDSFWDVWSNGKESIVRAGMTSGGEAFIREGQLYATLEEAKRGI